MFRDHPVNRQNLTGNEMMCRSGFRVEHCLCSIRRPIEGLMRSALDWTLMLQSYLILSLKVFDEDWIQRLPNQDYRRPSCVQSLGFRIQS